MKDGSVRQGTILEENPNFIRFEDPRVGQLRIPRTQISSVQKDADSANGGVDVETALAHAKAEQARGQNVEALKHFMQAAKASLNPQMATDIRSLFDVMIADGKTKLETMPDQARATFSALYEALTNPISQTIFSGAGSKPYQAIVGDVTGGYAEANVRLASRMANDTAMRPQVVNLYRDAVALTQSTNPAYLLGYGDAARANGDLQTAFNSYKAVIDSGRGNSEQVAAAYEKANRVTADSGGQYKLPAPTPQATPSPQPMVASGPSVAAVPVATPVATPAGPPQPWHKRVMSSITSGQILDDIGDLAEQFLTPEVLMILGVGLGILLLLWVIPYQILKFFAKRGDSSAGERLYGAKKLGIVSLIAYMTERASRARSTRHRCPFCSKSIDNMEDYKDLNFVVCPHCREPITPVYDMRDYIDHLIGQLKISQKAAAKGQRGDVLIEKNAMLKLVRGVLALAIRRRASDLHMETANEGGKVRARIDGIMYDLLVLPREISNAFISALKVMANLDITERRVPQDGKIPLWLDQKDYDLRINTSPASMGEKVVIRILRQDSINISPSKLGLDKQNLEIYERNIHKPHGVIIVTGPSGSGKSTTLYVALNELNSGEKNIVTIEDPIEYQLKGLSQMQVNPAANFTFANGLRSILRQDPDVIMVGEIRDKETAEAALDAAMTGHMVLTTLHTIDAPTAFSRMRDLGIDQARVSSAVNLVIAQRLVRTICPDCRKTYSPKAPDLEKLELTNNSGITFVHGTGCDTCMNTGYYGRLAIFEMLEMNDHIRTLLEGGAAPTAVREAAKENGMRSLRQEGIRKIDEGVTTVEEVIRVTT